VQVVGEVVQLERVDEIGSDEVVELELPCELLEDFLRRPVGRGVAMTAPA
jgi:hypothetical protein